MTFDCNWKSMEIWIRTNKLVCCNGYNVHMQSMPITTNVVRLNLTDGKMYSIQQYVINFVSDLWQISCFLPDTPVSSTNKTDCHDMAEILLKVALNIITITPLGFPLLLMYLMSMNMLCTNFNICRMSYLKKNKLTCLLLI